jgi:hypothetical protein
MTLAKIKIYPGSRSRGDHMVVNMNKVLEFLRFELRNAHEGDKMDISKLLEFSGETPDGEGRAWFTGDD